jgi:hypothetical protein
MQLELDLDFVGVALRRGIGQGTAVVMMGCFRNFTPGTLGCPARYLYVGRIVNYCYDPTLITKPKTFHIQNITILLGQKILLPHVTAIFESHWCSLKKLFKLFEVERGLVSLRHPPGTSICIQWNSNG